MKTGYKFPLIGVLLAAAGFVYAQGPMGMAGGGQYAGMWGQHMGMQGMMGQQGMHHDGMRQIDPARRQAMLDQRNAALKGQLNITAEQEPAWNAYVDAQKSAMSMANHQRPDPAELAKLSTPERLDKMQALRAQHMGEMTVAMDKRLEAIKTLYAALTPEQQKIFDAATVPGQHYGMGQHKGGRGIGPMMNNKS